MTPQRNNLNPTRKSTSNVTPDKRVSQLMDVNALATLLNVPLTKIYSLTRQTGPGSIPRYKIDRYLRFDQSEIMAWLETKRIA